MQAQLELALQAVKAAQKQYKKDKKRRKRKRNEKAEANDSATSTDDDAQPAAKRLRTDDSVFDDKIAKVFAEMWEATGAVAATEGDEPTDLAAEVGGCWGLANALTLLEPSDTDMRSAVEYVKGIMVFGCGTDLRAPTGENAHKDYVEKFPKFADVITKHFKIGYDAVNA